MTTQAELIGGFGAAPFGSAPFGTGPIIRVQAVDALAIRENVVRLTFNRAIRFTGTLGPRDGSQVGLYQVRPVEGTFAMTGEATRPVEAIVAVKVDGPLADGTAQVDLIVDRPFSPYPSLYTVTVSEVEGVDGTLLDPLFATVEFLGVFAEVRIAQAEKLVSNRDFANPQTLAGLLGQSMPLIDESQLGIFPADSAGDYAADQGLESYRKRIIRRLTTRKGAFAHLPGYGVGLPDHVKKLARRGAAQALAADAEEQIRQEPETQEVKVTVVARADGVVFFKVRARTNISSGSMDVLVPFNTGETSIGG